MWVKKEDASVIHYLKFVLDFKLTALKRKSLLTRLKRVQAKEAIFKPKQTQEYIMNFTCSHFCSTFACSSCSVFILCHFSLRLPCESDYYNV